MRESVHAQGDIRTNHRLEVAPAVDMIMVNFASVKVNTDGKSPDVWGERGERLETIL